MELLWARLEGRDGHTVGRELLGALVDPLPEILVTERGKPYFQNGPHFSISHCKNHGFCAVSDRNIGIDAEETDRKIDLKLMDRILSPAEKRRVEGAPDPRDALLRLWVQKESYAKLTGRGWGNYLRETDFEPENVTVIDGCYVSVIEEDEHVI